MRGAITPLFRTSLCYEAFKHWNKFTLPVLGRSRVFVVRKYVQDRVIGLCVVSIEENECLGTSVMQRVCLMGQTHNIPSK
jgi:hypothetical protein